MRAERERRGVHLRALASFAGLSPAYLSRIERGLSAEVADRLEAALIEVPAEPTIDGATIRAMREARGLTLRAFAELVRLSPGFVSRVETGQRAVTKTVACRMGHLTGAMPIHSSGASARK